MSGGQGMSRIRTLKPEILTDEKTAALSDSAWRLFVSLILLADDYGNLRGNPNLLVGQVFWAQNSETDLPGDLPGVPVLLEEIENSGLIFRYEIRNQSYISIRNWSRHQRIDNPGKPRVPGPSGSLENPSRNSRDIPETISSDPDPDPDQYQEGEAERERITICPLNLAETFTGYPDISKRYGVSIDALKLATEEFVTYWTIGAGTGKRRKRWTTSLRRDLQTKHDRGLLAQYEEKAQSQKQVAAHQASLKAAEQRERDMREKPTIADTAAVAASMQEGWK